MKGKSWILLVAATLVSLVTAVGWWSYDRSFGATPAGMVVASGRLEGERVRVSAQASGRVIRLAVREGDRVEAGQLIAELDSRDERSAADAARAAVAASEARVEEARRRVAALEAQARFAADEAARYRRLLEGDAVARQVAERAETEAESLADQLKAARAAHQLAVKQVDHAKAQLASAELYVDETTVTAPVAGRITAELARVGESAAPGVPIVELLRADDMKLRVYLPLADASRVSPGDEAQVYVEAGAAGPYPGVVEHVAPEAEFTPKDVHMPDERATLVFAVVIRIPNPDAGLKNGFPADAYIRSDPATTWPEGPPW